MTITPASQAIHNVRDDGTDIRYYIFKEHEVHYGELPPGVTQPWHHHTTISENLYIVSGKVVLHYLENDQKKERVLQPGDVIEIADSVHTLSNPFGEVCKIVAFRFVPSGKDTREIIKSDKVLHLELER